LGWLPYGTAYLLWEILSAAGLVAAVVLWPGPSPATKWLIACWTLPVFAALFNGQDDTLVLFWIALAAWLLHRRWPLAAGIALALAASKYHLIALVPMVILAQKRWRVMAGAIGGGCVLLALSFVGTGWDWPRRYLRMLQEPGLAPDVSHAPSFYANFQAVRFGTVVEIAAVILLAAVVFRVGRIDSSFERPVALALGASILVSLHSWMADCTLLLPALMLASEAAAPYIRFSGLVLATPMPWLMLQLPAPLPTFTRILILWLVLTGLARFGVKAHPPLVKLGKSHYTPS
jgi:hypothetical protein